MSYRPAGYFEKKIKMESNIGAHEWAQKTNYIGSKWTDKEAHTIYTVVDQTGLGNATPSDGGDELVVLKLTGRGTGYLRYAQPYLTLTIRAFQRMFAKHENITDGATTHGGVEPVAANPAIL